MEQYTFHDYYRALITTPLLIMAVSGSVLVVIILREILHWKNSNNVFSFPVLIERIKSHLLGLAICLFILYIGFTPFLRWGTRLMKDRSDYVISAEGTITHINNYSALSGQKYQINGVTTFGSEIHVGKDTYLIADARPFSVGDRVKITYLPESKCILSCFAQQVDELEPAQGSD